MDKVAALRNSPLHMISLFRDDVISKAEEITHHEDKQHSGGSHSDGSHKKSDLYHSYTNRHSLEASKN